MADALPRLREVLLPFIAAMQALSLDLVRALALSLGQPEHHFDPTFAVDPTSHLKVIRYPGRAVEAGERSQGVGAHKDYGYLAVLLQDDEGGLQVAGGNGFVDAVPVRDAFVCNIGEMFEVATRGYYRATVHRVVSPPPGRERISVPYFFAPRLDARLSPITLPRARRRGPRRARDRSREPDLRGVRRQRPEGLVAQPSRGRPPPLVGPGCRRGRSTIDH